MLQDKQKALIPDAVGFMLTTIQEVACHTFFNSKGDIIISVPSSMIKGAIYQKEDRVML